MVCASETITFNHSHESININSALFYYEDELGNLDPFHIFITDSLFKPHKAEQLVNFGHSKSVVWVKFKLKNNTNDFPVLGLNPEWFPDAQIFVLKNKKITDTIHIGACTPKQLREVKVSFPTALLHIPPSEEREIYIRFETTHILTFDLALGNHTVFYENDRSNSMFFYFLLGILTCVLIYNFVLNLSSKGFSNTYFIFYICFTMFSIAFVKGFQPAFMVSYWVEHSNIFSALMIIFLTESISRFVNLKEISKKLYAYP